MYVCMFHPVPASRGFASHVFLVITIIPREARAERPERSEVNKFVGPKAALGS